MIGPTSLHVRSINHKNAPTEVREKAHLEPERATELMDALGGHTADENHVPSVSENGCISVIPVSTCNRTEIYLEVLEGTDADALLRHGLAEVGADADIFFSEHASSLQDLDAVKHLYSVSAGLESMMLGEPQISAQLKDAYRLARSHHEPGPGLLRAFQGAFRAGKRVRTETRISNGAVSVAFAAVELARKFFDKLCDHRAVLVGAGETGGLAARHFLQHNIGHLTVVNRSLENAETLAATLRAERKAGLDKKSSKNTGGLLAPAPDPAGKCGKISVRPWELLTDALAEADVILSTTGATDPVILPDMVEAAVPRRQGKPLFLLDIAVPRDIHPDVSKIGNVFTFGLDDLDGIIQGNLAARAGQVPHAEGIIEEELVEFRQWLDEIDIRPTVAEFKAYLEELKDKQVGFVRKKQSDEVAAAVDRSLQQFIKKVLGRSVSTLKSAQTREERERDLETLKRIFAPDERD
ncbi:MAG: glutamyl-tRNA reductase [Candidatus Krumholzibacteriota bacterium]